MNTTSAAFASDKEARHLAAEQEVSPYRYHGGEGMELAGGSKRIIKLASTQRTRLAVQVVKEGGENNLHYHANTDIVYLVLKGRVRFYGPADKVYGEFEQHEGIVLPADSRYRFESTGDEPLELFQTFFFTAAADTAKRINVEAAKPWMSGVESLQHYEK